jgi:hypothetical protein
MIPWFWIWSPILHLPWSGSVAQQIKPNTNWFFDAIEPAAGNAKIEKKAFERASYGKQLGLITEILLAQAETEAFDAAEVNKSVQKLKAIQRDIEAIKQYEFAVIADTIVADIERLKKQSPAEYAALLRQLGKS